MVRLVEEFLDKYYEVEDANGIFSNPDPKTPDAVILPNSIIVSPDDPKYPPKAYSYGKNETQASVNFPPEQLKKAVQNAMGNDKVYKVEIKGKNADIADVYAPERGKYVSETDTNWDNWEQEYKAQIACEAAKGAVEDYLLGKKPGISKKADNNVAKVQNKWSNERAAQIADGRERSKLAGLTN